tara:strand:+ start:194 stop:1063 length:870 start_codon:yes stop_codon:yes gene_type:complete
MKPWKQLLLRFCIAILIVSKVSVAQGQKTTVFMDRDSLPIPYVHVSINNDIYGNYSDEKGVIHFDNVVDSDTVKVSCLGFESKSIPYDFVTDIVLLNENVIELSEFIVNSTKPISEYGVREIKRPGIAGNINGAINGMVLTGINRGILKSVWVYISQKSSQPINRFLLRINSVDSMELHPLNTIFGEKIFIPTDKKGWIKIDLAEFNISVSKAVFIGLESMPEEGNLNVLKVKDFSSLKGFVGYGFGLIEINENIMRCYGREGMFWKTLLQLEEYPGLNLVPMIRIEVQ